MNNYTVILYETDEPVVETNWTSYPGALAFANKIFSRRSMQAVKIWNGFAPEDPKNEIKEHDDLLYYLEREILPQRVACGDGWGSVNLGNSFLSPSNK